MKKFEFVQETKRTNGEVSWYTKCDGIYVSYSVSFDKEIAYNYFINLSSGGSIVNEVIILETKNFQ